ncbi:MAG: AzlC family ABC transporter permease, partial [Clostridia bacterium]|nr:AzlC family ABC transporter permease [Clostridia bacterium]
YFLMSCALSQRLSPTMHPLHRLGIAYGVTDEIFAVSVAQPAPLSPFYSYGLIAVAIPGWVLGTLFGAAAGNVLPAVLTNALGVALYGMFIAIVVPPAKENKVVAGVALLAMALSTLFTFAPVLKEISSGFRIILITVLVSALAALFFPVEEKDPAETEADDET